MGLVLRWHWNRMGRPLSPPQIHQRSFEARENSTQQLRNAGGGHQAPRKAAQCIQKEVGQHIKDKKRDKKDRDRDPSWRGTHERGEVSKHQETFSPEGLWGILEYLRAK